MTSTAAAAFTDRYAESYRPAQISTFVLYNARVDAEAKKTKNTTKRPLFTLSPNHPLQANYSD